jgi:hypothetical protein
MKPKERRSNCLRSMKEEFNKKKRRNLQSKNRG